MLLKWTVPLQSVHHSQCESSEASGLIFRTEIHQNIYRLESEMCFKSNTIETPFFLTNDFPHQLNCKLKLYN